MSKKLHSPNSGGGNKSLQQSDCGSANLYTLVCTAANLITLHTHHGSHVEGKKVNAVITEHQGCLSLQTLSKHSCVTHVSICSFYTGSATCADVFQSYEMYFMLWACCFLFVLFFWWQENEQSSRRRLWQRLEILGRQGNNPTSRWQEWAWCCMGWKDKEHLR